MSILIGLSLSQAFLSYENIPLNSRFSGTNWIGMDIVGSDQVTRLIRSNMQESKYDST